MTQLGFVLPAKLAMVLALLFALSSAAGLFWPAVYARETALWAAQGAGQDWFDLLVVAPGLAGLAWKSREGSRRAALLLGGTLVYTEYSLLIYTFAMHFNPIFLLYCAALGFSTFALMAAGFVIAQQDVRAWFNDAPARSAGGWLIACALLFALLWLAEIVPATLQGIVPRSIVDSGLITNPIHVLDLSIVLPAMLLAGVALLRNTQLGYRLAPLMLVFGVLMCSAILGMMITMLVRGLTQDSAVALVFAVVSAASGAVSFAFLRKLTDRRGQFQG